METRGSEHIYVSAALARRSCGTRGWGVGVQCFFFGGGSEFCCMAYLHVPFNSNEFDCTWGGGTTPRATHHQGGTPGNFTQKHDDVLACTHAHLHEPPQVLRRAVAAGPTLRANNVLPRAGVGLGPGGGGG